MKEKECAANIFFMLPGAVESTLEVDSKKDFCSQSLTKYFNGLMDVRTVQSNL